MGERLEQIRERLEGVEVAIPPPWTVDTSTQYTAVKRQEASAGERYRVAGVGVGRTTRQKDGRDLITATFVAHAPTDLRYLLDRIEAQAEVVEAARLKRNTLIRDGDRLENGKSFSGEWVAVPREDFDRLRRALDNLEEQTDD